MNKYNELPMFWTINRPFPRFIVSQVCLILPLLK